MDAKEIEAVERRLKDCTKKLHELIPVMGAARAVIEYNSDRRKNALAEIQRTYIERGESVAGSETLARSNPDYREKVKQLENELCEAYRVDTEWRATMASFEAARSLLAMSRETMKTLEG